MHSVQPHHTFQQSVTTAVAASKGPIQSSALQRSHHTAQCCRQVRGDSPSRLAAVTCCDLSSHHNKFSSPLIWSNLPSSASCRFPRGLSPEHLCFYPCPGHACCLGSVSHTSHSPTSGKIVYPETLGSPGPA